MTEQAETASADATISQIKSLRDAITPEQHVLLTRLWDHADQSGVAPARLLFHGLSPSDSLRQLEALGGGVVGEMRTVEESYALTLLGALASNRGREFEALVAQYLDYIVKKYNADPNVVKITREEVARDLGLSEPALSNLPRLVRLAAPSLCAGSSYGGDTWSLDVPRDIHRMTEVKNWPQFVRERAFVGYNPDRPVRDGGPSPSRPPTPAIQEPGNFSKRFGYSTKAAEITIREDATDETRLAILHFAEGLGLSPSTIRGMVCRILHRAPDPSNWSEYPNVWYEVQQLVRSCQWNRVYDIAEAIHTALAKEDTSTAAKYAESVNEHFIETGVGWQLTNGHIETRGTESFEASIHAAQDALDSGGLATASKELREALVDLSRRPSSDITGAIQHSMAALEAVARVACGDERATLGEIMKRHEGLIPRPLDAAVEKVWGFASEMGRHLREGREPDRDEAELTVGLVATLATYLVRKQGR